MPMDHKLHHVCHVGLARLPLSAIVYFRVVVVALIQGTLSSLDKVESAECL